MFLSGLLDANGGQLIKDLRERLPAATPLLANSGFLPISQLFATAGRSARGVYVSLSGLPIERLPREGRHFVAQFGATQPAGGVDQASVYAAQATEILLDAIAASEGRAPRWSRPYAATEFGAASSGASPSTPTAT